MRTQSGSSTPNPAPASSGPVSFRNRNAPGVSSSSIVGSGSRSASSSSPNSRAAAPSPASSSSTGSSPPGPKPWPAQASAAAGTIRLGSSVDCSANSTRHGSSSGTSRLGQPEAGPHRAGRDQRAVQPRVQLRGQLGGLGLVPRRHHVEASIGAGQCDHVPFGQRNVSRSTAAPRGQEGTGQAGARRGVGEAVERGGQQDARRIPGHGPARGGHGGGQVTRALHVRAAEHRAPAGRVRAVLGDQDRQHPAARRQAVGEAGQRGQVRQRGALVRQLAEAGGRAEQVQRGGRGEGQDRHPPAGQPDPATAGRRGRRVRRVRPSARRRGGRTSSGEASGRAGPAADGSCSVSSSSTALRAASPAGPGSAASRSASSAAWQANGCGAGAGERPGGAAGGPGPRPTGRALRAPRSRG